MDTTCRSSCSGDVVLTGIGACGDGGTPANAKAASDTGRVVSGVTVAAPFIMGWTNGGDSMKAVGLVKAEAGIGLDPIGPMARRVLASACLTRLLVSLCR